MNVSYTIVSTVYSLHVQINLRFILNPPDPPGLQAAWGPNPGADPVWGDADWSVFEYEPTSAHCGGCCAPFFCILQLSM